MPPVRNTRMPSSTVMSGYDAWSRPQMITSPRYRWLVGTYTATIGSIPCPRSTVNSLVRKPSTKPRPGCSTRTTRLNPYSLSGEKATTSCFTGA